MGKNQNSTGRGKFRDGKMVAIKGRGSFVMKCKDGQERVLRQVYFIPNLRSNIISIGQLKDKEIRL